MEAETMALHEGTKVTMGGRDFILPPLTLKALRLLGPKIKVLGQINDVPTEEQVGAMVEVVHASTVRNYPDMTPEDLEDLLDLGNLPTVFQAIMSSSGLKQGVPGEAVGAPRE
jgi:hypothetical protein